MVTSARSLINRSARIAGILASGETLSGNAANEALQTITALAKRWAADNLLIASRVNDVQSINSGGDLGQFSVDHAVIEAVSVNKDGDTKDYPIRILTVQEWQAIPDKTVTAEIPTVIFFENSVATQTFYKVWPIPNVDIQISAWYRLGFGISTLDSQLEIPDSIEDALIFDLACTFCIEYGRPINQDLRDERDKAKAQVKRTNTSPTRMVSDFSNTPNSCGYPDIRRGF